MSHTSGILFAASIVGALIVWVVGVCELVAAWRFWPWSFRFGPRWVNRNVEGWSKPASFERVELGVVPPTLRARMLSSGEILFRSHIPFGAAFGGVRHTMLSFKGRITWVDHVAHLEVRAPFGPLAFASFWLSGWTVGAVTTAQRTYAGAIAFWAVGAGTVIGMIWWSVVTERKRLQSAVDCLAERFGWTSITVGKKSPPN